MSKYEQKPNSGAVWRNKKRRNNKDPEFSGQCKIGYVEYWIAGYVNEFEGEKYFKLYFKPKDKPKTDDNRSATDTFA
jgi:hypothetical protein